MLVFISIKYHPDQRNRGLIESLSEAITSLGWETVCVVRDIEDWGATSFKPPVLMQKTFDAIHSSDLVVVELSEKGVGVGIEAGYTHALGKPVVVVAPKGVDISATLQGIASQVLFYEEIVEVSSVLKTSFPGS